MLIVTKNPPTVIQELAKVPVDVEWGGIVRKSFWKGVKHYDLLGSLRGAVVEASPIGRLVAGATAWLNRNGGDLAACFAVGKEPWVGITASNVMQGRLRVFCGMVEGDVRLVTECVVGANYTTHFDLHAESKALAAGWIQAATKLDAIRSVLKSHRLLRSDVDNLLMDAARKKFLPSKYVLGVDHLFREQPDSTAWDMLRAWSLGTTATPPHDQMAALLIFGRMLLKKCPNYKESA